MVEIGTIVILEALLLGTVIVLREPKLLIPCVVLFLPFEYLQTETVSSLGRSGIGGIIRTMLNPGKAAMVATVVVGAWRWRHQPARLIPNSGLIVPIVLLAAFLALGVAWSHAQRPGNTVAILPLYVAFVCVAPALIDDRRDIERIVGAFLVATVLMAGLAIAQRALGVFEWRTNLIESNQYAYRSNATFADPNNLARFLNIGMALAGGVILVTGARRMTVYLAIPAILLGLPALLATASRSGWLGFVLAAILLILIAPVGWSSRLRIYAFGGVTLAVAVGLLMFEGGSEFDRIKTFTLGIRVLGQRQYLIHAGWEMWKDSPFIGVGSGSYHHSLSTAYEWVLPWWVETTLSHTTIVTFLAEGGLLAIAMLAFVVYRIAFVCQRVYREARGRYARLMAGWCSISLIQIFLMSQAEGRLIEEPYLWVIFAIFAAVEMGSAGRVPAAATEAVPETVTPRVRRHPTIGAVEPAHGTMPGPV